MRYYEIQESDAVRHLDQNNRRYILTEDILPKDYERYFKSKKEAHEALGEYENDGYSLVINTKTLSIDAPLVDFLLVGLAAIKGGWITKKVEGQLREIVDKITAEWVAIEGDDKKREYAIVNHIDIALQIKNLFNPK